MCSLAHISKFNILQVLMGIHLLIFLVWIKSNDHTQYPLLLARACLNPDCPFYTMPIYGEDAQNYYIIKQIFPTFYSNYQLCPMNASFVEKTELANSHYELYKE